MILKNRLYIILILLITLSLTGCIGTKTNNISNQANNKTVLNIYNWGQYLDKSIIKDFTEKTGIEVNYNIYSENDDIYDKLMKTPNGFDIAFLNEYMVKRLSAEGKLAELNFNNIPNYTYIDNAFKNLPYDVNNIYSVPYAYGALGVIMGKEQETENIASWRSLFNNSKQGSIIMPNSPRDSFVIALKALGYSVNSKKESELIAAQDFLIAHKLVYRDVDKKSALPGLLNINNKAVVWSHVALELMSDFPDKYTFIFPNDGTNYYVDSIAVSNECKNKEAAEKFINFICRPENAYKSITEVGILSANKNAKEMADIPENKVGFRFNGVIKKSEILVDYNRETKLIFEKLWSKIDIK